MSDPVRQAPNAAPPVDPRTGSVAQGAGSRPRAEDPLEELARILGEGSAFPVRPETVVEVGRRATPTAARQVPQQLSALEAELFDELKSSVAPEARVIRGETERELPPVIPQRPVDDRDIASLRIDPGPVEEARTAERTHPHETPYSDYYAYDDGVAAGSYDPALAPTPLEVGPSGHGRAPGTGQGYPRPTFDEFGREEIALAAEETNPYASLDQAIVPHSRDEAQAASRLLRDEPRRGLRFAVVLIGLVVAAGGAYAGWKAWGGSSGEPVLIRADGKPVKQMPGPGDQAAPSGDSRPVLTTDGQNGASKLVSLQEDPVDQVAGRTPEGKEVRVINPGAPRPSSDQPHTVKTVVVRPDGSIVTDGDPARAAAAPASTAGTTPPAATIPPPVSPPAEAVTTPVVPVAPTPALVPANVPLPQPAPPSPTAAKAPVPAATTTDAGEAHPAPVKTTVVKPVAIAVPPTATTAPAAAPAPVKTVTTTPIQVPRPTQTAAANGGAPLALGPVAPRLASAQPPTTTAPTSIVPTPVTRTPAQPTAQPASAAPVATAPAAATGSGDYMVQISASRSDADARASFAAAQRRHPGLAGKSVDVQQANLGDKGTFYRARVAAGTREQAAALCSQIQSQGGQCMVVKR